MNELSVKHIEMIQNVIARFATNSFLVKGWSLTVNGALYGYTVNNLNWGLALVAVFPVLPFWYLDTYFLYHERLFRRLYDDVRRQDDQVEFFAMDIRSYRNRAAWWRAASSVTLVVFYGAIAAVGLGILAISLWPDS